MASAETHGLGARRGALAPAAVEEAPDQVGNLRRGLVQSKMSGVEQVHLGGGHVFAEGHRAGHRERQVVLTPHHQGRRLPLAEIRRNA
jgi:hypothetical protein